MVTDRRTRAFHHYSVGGELQVEEEQILSEDVVEVSCRWCGHGRQVEVLADTAAGADTADPGAGGPLSHPSVTLSVMNSDRDPGNG